MPTNEQVIEQTKKWVADVVVGCNFCPFAAKEIKRNSIRYMVESSADTGVCLDAFLKECIRLDDELTIETTLLIFPGSFADFDDYLDMVDLAEKVLRKNGYEGTYQVASFHPDYLFAGSKDEDASNYTNRSIYPMLHLLRESGIEDALQRYKNPEQIPEQNIDFARRKGVVYMKMLRDACM